MESVGRFEFNRKDLIGHGAFAVVFKGRHKEKRDFEVAVKCINKKNLAKSHTLLGKEIKILKEFKHENIVRLLDFQDMAGCVYLVMEYCNGGDLAEYLQLKGTLSEGTVRAFLRQIAAALRVLQSKGVVHRDLKPQNILLCHPVGRKTSPSNTCIKIADFGFARHLQSNAMAATLCGSPMYMAPEVIMSQTYDAKADLWSVGTIVYQCLTGKAPFQASTPQELRLFYERNRNVVPSIPRETPGPLRHLLLGLLQRNPKARMDFDQLFTHPFLEPSAAAKKSSPVPMPTLPSLETGASISSSPTSHPASPQSPPSLIQNSPRFLLKNTANQNSGMALSDTDDYVMVPAQFPSEITCEIGDGCLGYSGTSLLAEGLHAVDRTPPPSPPASPGCMPPGRVCGTSGVRSYSRPLPIPVPTQVHNYQRMEQHLRPAGLHGSTRVTLCCVGHGGGGGDRGGDRGGGGISPGFGPARPGGRSPSRMSPGGVRVYQLSPLAGALPEEVEATFPVNTRTGLGPENSLPLSHSPLLLPPHDFTATTSSPCNSPRNVDPPWAGPADLPSRAPTEPDPNILGLGPHIHTTKTTERRKGPFKRSLSATRLSDMLLKAAFGAQLLDRVSSDESLSSERSMDTTATPPSGGVRVDSPAARSLSTAPVTTGSSPSSLWPFGGRLPQIGGRTGSRGGRRHSDTDAMGTPPVSLLNFEPPELPEDTLMEPEHTDSLNKLRFTLAFVHCVAEMASHKGPGVEASVCPDVSFLERSLVADQISLLSREWSYAEQLVLYMKAAEFLSSALHTAMEDIRRGRLVPSCAVKQVLQKLNELYKECVSSCRCLNTRLAGFLLNKQRLMDSFNSITAEKIIYNHTVHMVQTTALDEMFHKSQASLQCYHKALLLMEGLSRIVSAQDDLDNVGKCKLCIERRISALNM